MHILLIHNDEAGDASEQPDAIATQITRCGHSVVSRALNDDWPADLRSPVDLVVVAGGDGTVSTVTRRLGRRQLPVAVLPMGTANNVAAALEVLGLPFEQQIRRWELGAHRRCDIGYALNARTDGRFLESVGVGLLAELMASVAHGAASFVDQVEDPRRRLAAARSVAVATLAAQPAVDAELVLDGVEMYGRFLLVEVMNFGGAGPGLQLAPHADWSDGAFDVVWATEEHRDSLMHDLARGAEAAGVVRTLLPTRRARLVSLRSDCRAHVDDRLVEDAFRLTLTVEREALTFA